MNPQTESGTSNDSLRNLTYLWLLLTRHELMRLPVINAPSLSFSQNFPILCCRSSLEKTRPINRSQTAKIREKVFSEGSCTSFRSKPVVASCGKLIGSNRQCPINMDQFSISPEFMQQLTCLICAKPPLLVYYLENASWRCFNSHLQIQQYVEEFKLVYFAQIILLIIHLFFTSL